MLSSEPGCLSQASPAKATELAFGADVALTGMASELALGADGTGSTGASAGKGTDDCGTGATGELSLPSVFALSESFGLCGTGYAFPPSSDPKFGLLQTHVQACQSPT